MTSIEPSSVDVSGERFARFYRQTEPRLRRALMAAYGPDAGREAAADALAWAWEHRDRVAQMDHPLAYLYRVGQSSMRRPKIRVLHARFVWVEPWIEPELAGGLARLSQRQRVTVVLVHGYGWTLGEVSALLDIKVTTVQNHLERGLRRLRSHLKVKLDD
jgi:DNA-directed RNA polymerase specialized sigma24 family protein